MIERFSKFPAYLAERSRRARLGPSAVPTLLAHPDWSSPAPVVVWMHGRTASKELVPGRYLRWLRAGIAACALDLPGHGERAEGGMDSPERTPEVLEQVLPEIDTLVEALAAPEFGGVFDLERMALGGMSAGGMATLRRLCDPHPFRCAAVESTAGDLRSLYLDGSRWPIRHDPARITPLDPAQHLARWRPIPLLMIHTAGDRVVPVEIARGFASALRDHYTRAGASADLVEAVEFSGTGAPDEHAGFGRYANDAKNRQTEFLTRHLRADPPGPP